MLNFKYGTLPIGHVFTTIRAWLINFVGDGEIEEETQRVSRNVGV